MRAFFPLLLLVSCAPASAPRTGAVAPKSSPAASQSEPLVVERVTRRIAAGGSSTCVVRSDGAVACWGAGVTRPVVIAGVEGAREVAVATRHACARRDDGAVLCFGEGTVDGKPLERARAIAVPLLSGATLLFSTGASTCAVLEHELVCTAFSDAPPIRKKLPFDGTAVIDATSGYDRTCLLLRDGNVRCVANNIFGAPAADTFSELPELAGAVTISASSSFTCAVMRDRTRACVGLGHPLPRSYEPGTPHDAPARDDATTARRLAAGLTTCWILSSGAVRCDGHADYGQRGNGATDSYTKGDVVGLTDAVELAVGIQHVCALRANNEVWCWGANDRAQLGDGTLADRTTPVAVIGLGGREPPARPPKGTGAPLPPPALPGAVASWREPDKGWGRSIDRDRVFSRGRAPTAVGVRAALFLSERLAVHTTHGVVGPITWPAGAQFLGLDGDDAVWVGTKDALLRADDVLAAKKGAFHKVRAIPFAVDFATAKGLVVAADASSLHVTRDGGKTFTTVKPAADLSIEEVFARSDGLVAITGRDSAGETSLWLARNGATFVRSAFQPPRLSQIGSHLYALGCPGAILSSDGATWNRYDERYQAPLHTSAWGVPLTPTSTPRPFVAASLTTLVDPPAPSPADPVKGAPGACAPMGGGGMGVLGGGGRLRRAGPCSGASCVRGTIGDEPRETATEVAFYGDAAPDRPPHVWIKGGEPRDVPGGCKPIRLTSAGGIGVLFCEKDAKTSAVYTIAKDGAFRAEGTVPAFPIDDVTIAADGTLVVHPVCGGKEVTCGNALVRAPVALGAASAWRTTTVARPLAYRALGAGDVLVVSADPADGNAFTLVIDRAGEAPLPFGPRVAVDGDLLDVRVHKDRVLVTDGMTTRKSRTYYLASDGLVETTNP